MNKKEMVQLSLMTEVASMYYEKDFYFYCFCLILEICTIK